MGYEIKLFDGTSLSAFAPLEPNINDKNTFFGGSGSSLMIISGWSLIKILSQQDDIQADIVIFNNQTKWLKALKGNADISAELVQDWNPQNIKNRIKANKSIPLTIEIKMHSQSGELMTQMSAKYFILPQKDN